MGRTFRDPHEFRPGFLDPYSVPRWPMRDRPPRVMRYELGETDRTQRELSQGDYFLDPRTNTWLIWEGPLQADHFIPVALFPDLLGGWGDLTPENQMRVIFDVTSIQSLPSWLSASKGATMPSMWPSAPMFPGSTIRVEIDREWRLEAEKHELWMVDYLQEQVNRLLYEQEQHQNPWHFDTD